jgi:hypothetical protein
MYWTTRATHMKCGMEVYNHKNTYNFCMKYRLRTNNYKQAVGEKFVVPYQNGY